MAETVHHRVTVGSVVQSFGILFSTREAILSNYTRQPHCFLAVWDQQPFSKASTHILPLRSYEYSDHDGRGT